MPDTGLGEASGSQLTQRGRVSSSWTRDGDAVALSTTIPVNVSAVVALPEAPEGVAYEVSGPDGAEAEELGTEAGVTSYRIGSGEWSFTQTEDTPDPDAPISVEVPSVKGDAVVGGRLRADDGEWDPAGATTTVQWLRDGAPISGATSWTYRPKAADVRARLSAEVTAEYDGTTATASSEPTGRVVKATSTVRASVRPGSVRAGQRVTVTVRVGAHGVQPTGTVTVRSGKAKRIVRLRNGRASASFRANGKGWKVVRVAYAGSDAVARSGDRARYRVR
ncbi:alpha-L-rhamnosidase C-terminal domain-containing protein [Nocardioides sambongensis]|uniref:alpha-L-rhamnosidase C-terminal domain-containing protein n=1 Tax=Nocardioides sambongensis TaxID=2589074 RepID=UPI001E53AE22|nr:Ig-like domain repeat protein [Nocardioides sambongensis]